MQNENFRILVVDDEEGLCEILQFNLESEGYVTEVAYSAEEALTKDIKSYDLLILDVMMGEMSGFKLLDTIRKKLKLEVPIIFITAKNTENDMLTGFNLGADDYIKKPFSIKEVLARVKSVLNRTSNTGVSENVIIENEELVLNFDKRSLFIEKSEVVLTKKEFEILTLLIKSKGRILSREEIMDKVWEDYTVVTDRTIDVHITRLRKKLGKYNKYIKVKSGYGYVFDTN